MNGNRIKNQKTIGNRLGIWAIAGLLIVAMFAATVLPVTAIQDLRITDTNLNVLQNSALWKSYHYGELMLWPSLLDASYQFPKMVGTIQATTVNDNKNSSGLLGQCVSFVKAMSKSSVPTTSADSNHWTKGDNVLFSVWQGSPARPGEVIATFDSNGNYRPGHAAIFRSYVFDAKGKITGIKVWDQNYLPSLYGVVARHSINSKGTTYDTDPNNADNYYTVRVP